jgi:predicted porin
MKKSLFAIAAVTAFAGAAQAQSSVTVYGLIDAGIAQTNIDYGTLGVGSQKQTSMGGLYSTNGTGTLSGSRLGFRGTEDLGGGNRAGFVFETAVNFNGGTAPTTAATMIDQTSAANGTGTNGLFGNTRQAYASLGNKGFGELRIGTQNSLAKDSTESIDPLAGATITGANTLYQQGLTTRYSQAATYQSPTMSGVTARLQTTVDGTPSNNGTLATTTTTAANAVPTSNRSSSASLDFTQGPIKVAAVYERRTTFYVSAGSNSTFAPQSFNGTTATAIPVINYYSVGGSYDFKVVKPAILYYNQSADAQASTARGKTSGTLLGVTVPVTPAASLFASYTSGKVENSGAALYDTTGMQLVANYNLSKRTGIYAAYGQTEWSSEVSTTSTVKSQQYGIGMRHSF